MNKPFILIDKQEKGLTRCYHKIVLAGLIISYKFVEDTVFNPASRQYIYQIHKP